MLLKNVKYTWAKYGRYITGTENRVPNADWCCQACGEQQPYDIDPFLFQKEKNEYLRICSLCQRQVVVHAIINFDRLIRICRHRILTDKI